MSINATQNTVKGSHEHIEMTKQTIRITEIAFT